MKSIFKGIFGNWAAQQCLPTLSDQDHKARRGKALLFAGSTQYPGAGVLAAKAAARMGAGYVTLAGRENFLSPFENPDFIFYDLKNLSWPHLEKDAVLVGPGLGVNSYTAEVLLELKKQQFDRVVLDADALTVCAQWRLFPLRPQWIVTPHVGELARCLQVTSQEINHNRPAALQKAIELFQCVVLLKGHQTLVGNQVRNFKITTGTSALAKAGTGDVLSGMITALRAQGLPPLRAALLGAYVHGATANLWEAQGKDALSMMASDVIKLLPLVLRRMR